MPKSAFRILYRDIWARLIVVALLLFAVVYLCDSSIGNYPPVGRILNPYTGLWLRSPSLVENFERRIKKESLNVAGLKGTVSIHVDQDRVKHIFAENDDDLYFAQGFVVASDRLWQMEFIARVVAGRLSEVFGETTLETDKFFLKLGLADAATDSLEIMLQDPMTERALESYAQGVNAYIESLTPETLPFEYKLLGHVPERWSVSKAALLLKFMAFTLSGYSVDLPLTRSRSRVNAEDFETLFPTSEFSSEPVIPKRANWSFDSRAPERPSDYDFVPDLGKLDPLITPHPNNGSNNWLVTGAKSATGFPILSNDIHLSLSLPAIWYEIQLSTPKHNVYGVTLPGSPGVILGFNPKLAWAVTNGASDVLDWYELRFRDENLSEYLFDGQWRPVVSSEHEIGVRGRTPVKITLRRTHLGPIVYDRHEVPFRPHIPRGLAMRWTALEGSNELKTFMLLNRSTSVTECRQAIEGFQNPSQNFLCADSRGETGIWHMGRFPVRWKGQGRTISNGTSSQWEWQGWVPKEEVPAIKNPPRGYLSSANQNPVDESYPHYLGWFYDVPFRGMRINEILKSKNKFKPMDMVQMQMDSVSLIARATLPKLLAALDESTLDESGKKAFKMLKSWDHQFRSDSEAATVFFTWFKLLESAVWQPFFPDPKNYFYPSKTRLVNFITQNPDAKWFDDPATGEKENLKSRARTAFKLALQEIKIKAGSDPENWRWGTFRPTRLEHMGKIPGLGITNVPTAGLDHSILANTGTHGPAWKLVVALGPKPKAWGVYPGGQSGDPTSPFYDNFVEPWAKGEMKQLNFLDSSESENKRLLLKFKLQPSVGLKAGAK